MSTIIRQGYAPPRIGDRVECRKGGFYNVGRILSVDYDTRLTLVQDERTGLQVVWTLAYVVVLERRDAGAFARERALDDAHRELAFPTEED
jgi:hypothetical protein